MVVYGNIIKTGNIADTLYNNMSSVLLDNLQSVHDLGDVLYFTSSIKGSDTNYRLMKGLSIVSSLQLIHPHKKIKRPMSSRECRLTDEELQLILKTCNTSPSSIVKS